MELMATSKYLGRILLVDDDEKVTRFYDTVLAQEGYIVDVCHDLKHMKELMAQFYFDAVLLDLQLGHEEGMNGLPFVLKVAPSTKVFILTSNGSIEKAVASMRCGATGFLTKGMDPEKIVAELASQLSPNQSRMHLALDGDSLKKIGLVGESEAINETVAMIDKIRKRDIKAGCRLLHDDSAIPATVTLDFYRKNIRTCLRGRVIHT